jgi:SAM-dependent methyltransferase
MAGCYVLTTPEEYLEYKAQKLGSILAEFKGSNILELGCGFGWNLATLRGYGHTGKLIGVEISPTGLNLGKEISEKYNLGIHYEELNLIDAQSTGNMGNRDTDTDLILRIKFLNNYRMTLVI